MRYIVVRRNEGGVGPLGEKGIYVRARRRTYELLKLARPGDRASHVVDVLILVLILLNVAGVILATVESVVQVAGRVLMALEVFSVAVFTVEYVLRLWSVVEKAPDRSALVTRARYATSWLAVVDLLAILPAFLTMVPVDLRILRLFRLFRLARLLKLGRYSRALQTFVAVLREKREDLVVAVVAVLVLLVISSSLMYFAENEAQPGAFPSIPAAMWWGAAALTTVGYGDVYPITVLGRLLGTITSILGIGLFAIPAGVLASGFSDALARRNDESGACPVCGRPVAEPTDAG